MKEDISLSKLEKCGWFNEYPVALSESVKRKVSRENKVYDLALIGGDTECINEKGDYSKWYLNEFATASCGLFTPENIKEKWKRIDQETYEVTLSFKINGKEYSTRFEQVGDYANPQVLELINDALEGGTALRLIKLEIGAQDEYYALTTIEAYAKAYKSNLLPKWDSDPFNEASWPSEPDPLSLCWYLKKQNAQSGQLNQRAASTCLQDALKNSIKKDFLVHLVFASILICAVLFKSLHYISSKAPFTLVANSFGASLSQLLVWIFSYRICLVTFPDTRKGYLIISICALYFSLFSYPIIGWLLVFFMYMKDRSRFNRLKNELRDAVAELRATPIDD